MSFLVLRIDLLMVQYLLGAEEAGYYSIATSMGDVFCMLPVVVGAILFPKLSGFASDGQKWSLTKEASLWVTAFISLFAILAAILARPTIQFFYGEAFIPAVSPFLWLLPGLIILSVNTVFMNYFASIGMPSVVVYSPAIATLLNIGMNLKLVPWLGIVGASLSSGVCYGVMLLFSLLYIHRKRLADEP
jgi:O-antigen/teichoic acid export membrane protein